MADYAYYCASCCYRFSLTSDDASLWSGDLPHCPKCGRRAAEVDDA